MDTQDNNQRKELLNFSEAGWSIVRSRLIERIDDFKNIENISDSSDMLIEMKARKLAKRLMEGVLDDIEGDIQLAVDNNQSREDGYIIRK